MQQTSKYQFNLVENTDDFSPAPLNQNMEKVEEELETLEESLATVMETVDGHKLAVGSYQGNGGSQTINVGFNPTAVLVVNQRVDVVDGYSVAMQVPGGSSFSNPNDTVLALTATGFTASGNMCSSYYRYNYLAIC